MGATGLNISALCNISACAEDVRHPGQQGRKYTCRPVHRCLNDLHGKGKIVGFMQETHERDEYRSK